MIQFSKLRLHGFKSFVEKTEVDIGPGLTGIVGPNGCGKSNLVEALRWSMGESSTKRMRGGSRSMDDVIFAGTTSRPARNMAEVSILLDNSRRTAPQPYNNGDEIEVVRRIERENGSGYRINGKPARARDVQLLYADILSGANSPYLVSQGRVTQIIQAKPGDRRMILEEAAGITGLYARRHEAELRLRATDANLKRLDDQIGGMEDRLNNLKKQARQAARYRNLSAQIRQLEIAVACLEWRAAHEKLQEVRRAFGEAESRVGERLVVVTQLTKTQTVQSKDLPDLRQKDAQLGATLQAHTLALQRLEDEQGRLSHQIGESTAQIEQIKTDRVHEQQTLKENTAILERLDGEEKTIKSREESADADLSGKDTLVQSLKDKVGNLDTVLTELMESVAESRARRQSLERQAEQDTHRAEALKQRLADIKIRIADMADEAGSGPDIETLKQTLATKEQDAATARETVETLQATLETLQQDRESRRHAVQDIEKEKSKINTEISMLESILNADSQYTFRPVFEDLEADKGFEVALSRALGDSLAASLEDDAPAVWRPGPFSEGDLPALPEGAAALAPHIKAPAPLKPALSQIGFVETAEDGEKLAAALKPGQSLVSRDGAYWRWDGLHLKVTASDQHALRLRQKNDLAELKKSLPAIEKKCAAGDSALKKAVEALEKTQERIQSVRAGLGETEAAARTLQNELNRAIEDQAKRQADLAKLEEAQLLAGEDLASVEQSLSENREALGSFDEATLTGQQERTDKTRADLAAEREKLQNAVRDYDIARQDQSRRKARIQAIGDERINLQNRCIRARERLKDLDERETQLSEKIGELKKRPAVIREESEALLVKISVLEKEKGDVSDKLAVCESELAETTKALKEAESGLSEAREARAGAQATAEERQRHLESARAHIREHFDMTPEQLMAEAAMDPDALPALDSLKEQREKAARDRDMIGPVNLRADQEAEELEKELSVILSEKGDLVDAVNELRQGIQKLNREARERLQAAFSQVNGHFREMFTRLFNGGKAYLALIESDDPLEAGLEIFAQPPGKSLQSLSLLSGGEQTMTAVALIFAMFLTNPAPICVLDEVDAPLDDANVDRFCDVLEEFADKGDTRFLVITHHRLTMARMDRLYGVTMSEQGVSQLVSVDLNQQLDFLEAAE